MTFFPSVVILPLRALRLLELFLDSSERIFPKLSDYAKGKFQVCAFIFKPLKSSVFFGEAICIHLVWLQAWAFGRGVSVTAFLSPFGDGVQLQ